MDFSNDEIRRQLAETQRAHDEAQPTIEAGLRQAFDPDTNTPTEARAALLGVPSRRGFLTVGGLVLSSAALAACVNPKQTTAVPVTGTLPATTTTVAGASPASPELDKTLVNTALSLEYLAIDTYTQAIAKGYLIGVAADAGKYFSGQHQDHADALKKVCQTLGVTPTDQANAYLNEKVVQPGLAAIEPLNTDATKQLAALKLAMSVEDIAAQTYTEGGGVLSTKTLRQTAMSIGGIEARHYSVLAWIAGQPMVPFAFEHTNNAAPDDAMVTAGGTAGTTTTTGK